jgi:iron complex outermembrane receptor protein
MGLISFWPLSVYTQEKCSIRLYGRISDHHDGSSLAYANLLINTPSGKQLGVGSNEAGKYEVDGLCPGNYALVVSHIGCLPDTFRFYLESTKRMDFELEHHLEELAEVEIKAERRNSIINQSEVDEELLLQSSGDDLANRLKRLPGVNAFKTGSNVSKPMIGGFTSNRIQIINNGVQHQNQNWGDEHAPEINPFQYANYKVVRGASAVRYGGGALGGFVLVEPKPLKRSAGINGRFSSLYATNNRMYAASLMLEGNSDWLPKLSWRVQGSHRRAGNLRSPDYYQDNTGLNDLDYSWNLGWYEDNWKAEVFYSLYNSKLGIFSGAHIGNLTDLENAIAQERPRAEFTQGFSYNIGRPYQLITHELLKGSFSRYFQSSQLKVTASRQFNIREEFDKETPRNQDLAALNIPEFSISLEAYELRADYEIDKGELQYELGAGLGTKENTVNSFIDFIPDYTALNSNLYGLVHWHQDHHTFSASARVDQSHLKVNKLINREFQAFEHDFTAFTLSTGVLRTMANDHSLSVNLNFAERAPAINELYSDGLHHGTASLEFGNPNLNKERSYNARMIWEKTDDRFDLEVQLYGQYIEDFIYAEPNGFDLTIRGAFPVFDWKNTDAFLRGADLSLNYRFNSQLEFSHKSSWLWADQLNSDEADYLVNMPANRFEHQLRYRAASTNGFLDQWNMWLSHQYVFRQERYDEEVEIAAPPEAYQLWAVGLDREIKFSEKINGQLGFRIENLLNTTYRDYLNRFRFYADEMGRDLRINFTLIF